MLAKPHALFRDALYNHYSLGSFNVSNLEFAQAIVAAAEAQRAPVMVQTSEGAIKYGGLNTLVAIVRSLAEEAAVPVVLHLDHGKSFEVAKKCIDAGYGSVMIDAAKEPLEDNIALTQKVVRYAHERGVWVEAELGAIMGAEGAKELAGGHTPSEFLTNPDQVEEFIKQTEVDALAVAVGTIHGAFTGQEYIRFELLEQIEKIVPGLPLVVHGASGIADEHLQKVATSQVCKINVDTEMRIAFERVVKAYFDEQHDKVDPRDILGPAREAVQKVVEGKLQVFGCSGKAKV